MRARYRASWLSLPSCARRIAFCCMIKICCKHVQSKPSPEVVLPPGQDNLADRVRWGAECGSTLSSPPCQRRLCLYLREKSKCPSGWNVEVHRIVVRSSCGSPPTLQPCWPLCLGGLMLVPAKRGAKLLPTAAIAHLRVIDRARVQLGQRRRHVRFCLAVAPCPTSKALACSKPREGPAPRMRPAWIDLAPCSFSIPPFCYSLLPPRASHAPIRRGSRRCLGAQKAPGRP